MADFSGIGAFGAGALEGYDKGLSRYATIEDMRRRREAEQRAAQAQALQSLIQGTQLAAQQPDVAEAAMQNPAYGLEPGPMQAGVARARTIQSAGQKFMRAVQTGDFDENDTEIGQFVLSNPEKYMPMLGEALGKKRLKQILADPNLTPQQRMQAIVSSGAKVDLGQIQAAYPGLVGGVEAERTAGGLRGGMQPGPGGQPLVGETEGAKEAARGRARLGPAPELPRGTQSMVEAEAQAQATGRGIGENVAELAPWPGGAPSEEQVRRMPARIKAQARQTPEQAEWLRGKTEDIKTPKISADEKAKLILGELQAKGYHYDKDTGRVWTPQDMPNLAKQVGRKATAPREVNGVLVFNPRPFGPNMSLQERLQLAEEQTRQWLGKEAITGEDEGGQPVRRRVTKQIMKDFYQRQLGPAQ